MGHTQYFVPLAVLAFLGLQILFYSGHSEVDNSPVQRRRLEQEAILDDSLQVLQENTVKLKELYVHLDAQLREDAQLLRTEHSGLQGNDSAHARADSADDSAEKMAALEQKVLNIAMLVEDLGSVSEERAAKAVGGRPSEEDETVKAPGELIFPPGNEDGECVGGEQEGAADAVAAVVTVTFDRADYLKRHLDSLMAVHGKSFENRQKFPLFISQDGKDPKPAVASLARSYQEKGVRYLHHKEDAPPHPLLNKWENLAYYRIANHYKFILRTFFDCFGYSKLIILEDDMELAPDFFSYFEATGRLLANDSSIYCISSWNDHGQEQFVRDQQRLYRSDFFPGLGWMLTKELWLEIRDDWPKSYWDDWLRLNKVRKGRQCIRPEVCRTYNFGAKGSSKGFFYKRFLAPIRLSDADLDWAATDLSYLDHDRYDAQLNATLAAAPAIATVDEAKGAEGNVRLLYDSQEQYEVLTGRLGMLREWKDGVPRGSYRGIVVVHVDKATIYLAPSPNFRPPNLATDGKVMKVDSTGALVRRRAANRKEISS